MIKKIVNLIKNKDHVLGSIIRDSSVLLIGDGLSSVFALISLTLLLNYITPYEYGLIALIQGYALLIDSLVNFQSWQALIKYGAQYLKNDDKYQFNSIVKTCFVTDIATSTFGAIIAILISDIVIGLLKWDPQISMLIKIYSISIVFHISGMPTGVLRLLNKFKLIAYHAVSFAVIKTILTMVIISIGLQFQAIIYLYLLFEIVKNLSLVIITFMVLHKEGYEQWHKSNIIKDRDYYSFLLFSNLASSVDIPVKKLDIFIISSAISVEAVGIFKLFKQLAQIITMVSSPIYKTIYPRLAEYIAIKDYKNAINVSKRIGVLIFGLFAPMAILMFFFTEEILNMVYGPFYAENWLILVVYIFSKIIINSFVALHPLFIAMGYIKNNFYLLLYSNILYLVLIFSLVNAFGIFGIIIAEFVQALLVIVPKFYIVRQKALNPDLY